MDADPLVQGVKIARRITVSRVPAYEIEAIVARTIRQQLKLSNDIADADIIRIHVSRVEVESDQLLIELIDAKQTTSKRTSKHGNLIEVPWHKTPAKRRREILCAETGQPQTGRPIRSENRALLVASIARGRRWLDELITNPVIDTERLAAREGCTPRQVNMTISLAFLAPDLVKAAIEGRLPRGFGVTRMRELPAEWTRQRQMLDL